MITHYHFNEIDSTNTQAKVFANNAFSNKTSINTGVVFTADTQTKGRGRGTHHWYSSPRDGLYYSLLIPAPMGYDKLQTLTQKIGKLTINVIHDISGILPTLEWPNDIIMNDKKLGGILIESVGGSNQNAPRYVIIGIGINLNHTQFPNDLTVTSISIRQITQSRYNSGTFITTLTKEIMTCLFEAYEGLLPPKKIQQIIF